MYSLYALHIYNKVFKCVSDYYKPPIHTWW